MEKFKINGSITLEPERLYNSNIKKESIINNSKSINILSKKNNNATNFNCKNLNIDSENLLFSGGLGRYLPFEAEDIAKSIATCESANADFSPIFHEGYNGSGNYTYNNPNILFRNENGLYGNVWIQMTGSSANDYAAANLWATSAGIYENVILGDDGRPIPAGNFSWTWHHVYMGWFKFDPNYIYEDGLSTCELISYNNDKVYLDTIEEIYTFNNNTSITVLDARKWQTYWNPFSNWCLMQLVRSDAHTHCSHTGTVKQYKDVCTSHKTFLGQQILGYV